MREGISKIRTPEHSEDPVDPLLAELKEVADEGREDPPEWLNNYANDIASEFFDPKNFESPELYEQLGIRAFKKYMPTTGDLISRLVWKKMGLMSMLKGDPESIQKFITESKFLEVTHYVGFAVIALLTAPLIEEGAIGASAGAVIMNLLVNVYPIMLQRYNRMRATEYQKKVLEHSSE
jgi:hypothetical protein